mgnify:CR=1 FL=1
MSINTPQQTSLCQHCTMSGICFSQGDKTKEEVKVGEDNQLESKENLPEFTFESDVYDFGKIEQGDNYVTLRMPLNNIEQAMSQESVLLIDKTLNKIVGTRIYSNNQLLQSNFFGYNKGEVQSLNAIKTIQKIQLVSGNEIDMISYSKIDDMEFNLNL